MELYNTLHRKQEKLIPVKDGQIGIYSCGPTVYWNQHIGNIYAYIIWDTLVRALRYQGLKVKWVMNITDVGHLTGDNEGNADSGEDRMEKGAKREGLTVWQIADKYINQFLESTDALGIKRPDVLCRATEHIDEQINLIQKIEANGYAYKTGRGLVFDTGKFSGYADFAKLNLDDQQLTERVEDDLEKKKPWDFYLWITDQKDHAMLWDSPWGKGFPGWHIECTAMSTKYLGESFDIHTGGKEHVGVHHTNEIAQGYGAFGHQTANYWLHNEWLTVGGEKIAKSSGKTNILVSDLIEKGFDPLAFRYLVFNSTYRKGQDFTWELLASAQTALLRLRKKFIEFREGDAGGKDGEINKGYQKQFLAAINDDLNFPKALAVLWKMVDDGEISGQEKAATLVSFDQVLGLGVDKGITDDLVIPAEATFLLEERNRLRSEKSFTKADEVRQKIEAMGYVIEDGETGSRLLKNAK